MTNWFRIQSSKVASLRSPARTSTEQLSPPRAMRSCARALPPCVGSRPSASSQHLRVEKAAARISPINSGVPKPLHVPSQPDPTGRAGVDGPAANDGGVEVDVSGGVESIRTAASEPAFRGAAPQEQARPIASQEDSFRMAVAYARHGSDAHAISRPSELPSPVLSLAVGCTWRRQ